MRLLPFILRRGGRLWCLASTVARASAPALTIAALAPMTGCDRRSVQVYEVPKEPGLNRTLMAGMVPVPASVPITWTKPAGWEEQAPGEMRQGSFLAHGPDNATADVSVTAFPGAAGGLESNLNRWRGQVGLPPLSGDELQQAARPITADRVPGLLVDYAAPDGSKEPSRILGAVFQTPEQAWFVKMTGPRAWLEAQQETFTAFVQSLRFRPAAPEPEGDGTNADVNLAGRPKSTNER
ncbi:MAG TPA: hypothetical protein VGD78_01200 [Chthoniobacterales bacterium]